jgi:hypothetical protein
MNANVKKAQTLMPVPANDAGQILSIIERIATNPEVDIEKMERFMAMRREELARQAQIAFNAAMRLAQAEMPQVLRDEINEQTQSAYAKYETISEAMQPVITKHGFALTFGEADSPKPNHLRITCDVLHECGHTKPYHADVPIDATGMKGNPNKSPVHAFVSTFSYGKRVLKLAIFDVALKGEPEGEGPRDYDDGSAISKAQAAEIQRLLKATNTHAGRLCAWLKVDRIHDIPAQQYQRAVDALNRIGKQAK